MKKINVCHVVSALKSGGAESMIYNYCSKLPQEKYNMYLLYQYEASQKNLEEFKSLNFTLKQITPKKTNILKNYLETKEFFIKNKIDIVHCHMTIANFLPLIAAKNAKVKIRISHSHEAMNNSKNPIKKILLSVLKKMCNKYSNIKIACGQLAGEFLYGKNDFIILKNAIDISKFCFNTESRKKIREKLGIKSEEIVIGHVGRFIDVKNHKFIIDCFEQVLKENNKYKLILCGAGELEDEIKKIVHEKKIDEKVIFTGVISNTSEYYSGFDIFILPSKREGMPIVAIEAQASGLTCFFSNTIDKNTLIDYEKSSFIDLDMDKWKNAILNFKPQNRTTNIKNFIEKGLEINTAVDKLKTIYENNNI